MGRSQVKLDKAQSHICPKCAKAGFPGYLVPDGSGGVSCLNCGYTADLATGDSKSPSKKMSLQLSGQERKKESGRIGEKDTRLSTLSPKEKEVLDLAARRGYKNQQIAESLGWQVGSVNQYMNRIFSKLQLGDSVNKRASAVRIYLTGNTVIQQSNEV